MGGAEAEAYSATADEDTARLYGAIAGGLLIAMVETFVAGYISSNLKDFIAFAVLMVFLFVKPTGLFNERALQD